MVKTRFGKTTKGINAEVFVTGECAYTSQTTYGAFAAAVNTATDGEIGVFNEDGTTRTTALTAGNKFFIAQKITGSGSVPSIKKSVIYTYGGTDTIVAGYVYTAPVKPVAYIGFNGTTGSLNGTTIAVGQDYGVTLLDTTPPTTNPLDTASATRTVAGTSETFYSILGDGQTGIAATLNGTQTLRSYYSPIYSSPGIYVVDVVSNGTYTAVTTTASHGFTNGSINVVTGGANNVVAGDTIRIGTNAGTTGIYKVVTVGTTAFSGATANDYTLDRPYTGTTATVTVFRNTVAPTEYGLKITTKDYFTTFRATVQSGFANATFTYAVSWNLGNGTPEEIVEEEIEGSVFHGNNYYNIAFTADYGIPKAYTNLSRAYATIKIQTVKRERSIAAPVTEYSNLNYCFIAAPYASTTFTLGGTLQTNGFSAITSPQASLSAAAASPIVTLATIFPNVN